MKIERKPMLLISNINHGSINKFFSLPRNNLFRSNRYVDLLQMIQPDYSDDHIIVLLLKEMEEFSDVNFCFY